ncbi:hypothetical protein A2W14_02215 [Candidatus Gottesmanbacteria bacterium RBG_16_37_8]|uniref:Nuclear transport factor 2 family protein n=1 Tax=Candidatus Gottesmanbacteria bacterium RBG_16_37_8 TaxID=1798371 RepID=A0A1F5YS56_9BACT|nr:MAG: hypothetical protein A2W14_02215 [Candidatus Gottesmanbacteria bacterium RBG_16_37_8]
MNLTKVIAVLIGIVVVATAVLTVKNIKKTPLTVVPGDSVVVSISDSKVDEGQVPTIREEDIIRSFFALIDQDHPSDAISMMTPALVGDEKSKQTWGVHFDAIENISITLIEPSMQEEWTDNEHIYKITLEVTMKPESAFAPIPNYGWDNGSNIRWLSIEKISSLWKITGIATGP